MPADPWYRPAPRIAELGNGFYDVVRAAEFPKRVLRYRNDRAASRVGLSGLSLAEWEAHFARFEPLAGNLEQPLALRYHGHQFNVYNPSLGDGRGFLFAQALAAGSQAPFEKPGELLDLATKGSGRTPWSRGGDGRLTLKGGVREVLATEMLEALGVRTSKSLSLYETGEELVRGDEPSPTRSSVLVRLGYSHIRFGTFQRLAYEGDVERLERLLSYSIRHYYPELEGTSDRVASFFSAVTRQTASLCASVMVAGFVHGVLNSDNMVITGEMFDYGPYRFLPTYDPAFVAAYFDDVGLYAYGRQPRAFLRNLARLGEALRPLAPETSLAPALAEFEPVLERDTASRTLDRLGLASRGDSDAKLSSAVHAFLAESGAPYENFFFDLHGGLGRLEGRRSRTSRQLLTGARWDELRAILRNYEPSGSTSPAYFEGDEPCTLLIGEVEQLWQAIAERDDWGPFEAKVTAIRRMGVARSGGSPESRE